MPVDCATMAEEKSDAVAMASAYCARSASATMIGSPPISTTSACPIGWTGAGAVTASTLTTVAVFSPIALVGGIVGELFSSFAMTITVALLGRSRAWGVFAAGLLFGALKAGSFTMQIAEGIPVDIVLVVQSLIVLFIAAPPMVRAIFRLPAKEAA